MPWSHEYTKAYNKQYREVHREKQRLYMQQWYKNHCKEQKIDSLKRYRQNRKTRILQMKKYDKANPEVNLKAKKKQFKKMGLTQYDTLAWAKTIRKRDGKCTWCNSTEKLVAHHIWHKIFCPESALDVDNGITLCHDCHKEQHRLDRSDN
tara:strand:+ start:43 stop:492 length:450 start_codon:yes stop_codon:yes gene_type:complete